LKVEEEKEVLDDIDAHIAQEEEVLDDMEAQAEALM